MENMQNHLKESSHCEKTLVAPPSNLQPSVATLNPNSHPNSDATASNSNFFSGNDFTRLLPVPVLPFAPVRQDERQHYLQLLHSQYCACNKKFDDDSQSIDDNVKNSLIKISVEKELKIAESCKSKMEYQHAVKKLMFNLKKFGTEDGLPKTITEMKPPNQIPIRTRLASQTDFDFDLVYRELQALCIPVQRLKRNAYVTELVDIPADYQLQNRVNCVRCDANFKLEDIQNTVNCTYHPGKMQSSVYENMNVGRKVYGTDYLNRYYACCNEPKGQSAGCQKREHHVYKYTDPKDLHSVKKFVHISDLRKSLNIDSESDVQKLRREKIKAVSLDCEMCYTNNGFEMMKLSLIDFKTEKKLIDSIVHPDGNFIIDLNTHVSGVESIPKSAMTFDEVMIKIAQLTDEDTIIIGHGLENDLNVLRLIYPRIVDTAILFSENQINSRRKDPLKKLAWKYLSENIQGKEHDSLEDAIIPTRIVKKHIDKFLRIKQRNKLRRR